MWERPVKKKLLICILTTLYSATPSQKYSMRGARGEVVATFGAVQGPRWAGKGQTAVLVELLEGREDSLTSSYKYMFQRLRDVRDGMSTVILPYWCSIGHILEH